MLFADTPSLGLLIGLPIGLLCTAAFFGVALWIRRDRPERSSYDYGEYRVFFWGAVACGIVAFLTTAGTMFPYGRDYHFWKPVKGHVERVSKRLVPAGDNGGMEEKIVVVVNGQPYGVTDTRASLLHEGDPVSLNCKKSWQFASRPGWDCRWAS